MVYCPDCRASAYIESPMKVVDDKDYQVPADVNYCFHCGKKLEDS